MHLQTISVFRMKSIVSSRSQMTELKVKLHIASTKYVCACACRVRISDYMLKTGQTLMYWKIMFDRCYCINSTKNLLKIWEKYGTIVCHRLAVNEGKLNFLNIHLLGPRASNDSRWRSSFDSTSMFRNDKLVAVQL